MYNFIAIVTGIMLLAALPAFAATAPVNLSSRCPITHNCRRSAMQALSGMVRPAGARLPCPQGTIAIPHTNRCKVLSTGQ